MSYAGWGGICGRVDSRVANNRTVARWSGNTSTAGTTPNRAGGAVPSMLQPTSGDQPAITTLVNGVKALTFDGTNSDLLLAPSAAVALLSPRLYWAFHCRFPEAAPSLRTVWAEWGTTERIQFATDSTSVIVTVALSAVTTASATFPLSVAARQAGVFLEVFFDGNALPAANRLRLYVGQVEVTASASTGTMPTSLLLGNAVSNWLGSLNGSSNRAMSVAHFWYLQGHPSSGQRTAMAADETPDWTFHPSQLSNLGGWLRAVNATSDANGVSILPDELDAANPAVKPGTYGPLAVASAGNGKPCLKFEGLLPIRYNFRTGNTGGDPLNSQMKLQGSATQNLCTSMTLDAREADNSVIGQYFATMNASSNATKAFVRLVKDADLTAFLTFTITSVVDGGSSGNGYYFLGGTVTGSSAANPFADGDLVWAYIDITTAAGVISPRRTLTWPLTAANSASAAWGWAGWIFTSAPLARGVIWSVDTLAGGASLSRLRIVHASGTFAGTLVSYIAVEITSAAGVRRVGRSGIGGGVAQATWTFVTVEYNPLAATEATKLTLTQGAALMGLTFYDLSATTGAIGALAAATGNAVLGNEDAAGTMAQFRGLYGPDLWIAKALMPGVSEGVWTPAQRVDLMNYNKPT